MPESSNADFSKIDSAKSPEPVKKAIPELEQEVTPLPEVGSHVVDTLGNRFSKLWTESTPAPEMTSLPEVNCHVGEMNCHVVGKNVETADKEGAKEPDVEGDCT